MNLTSLIQIFQFDSWVKWFKPPWLYYHPNDIGSPKIYYLIFYLFHLLNSFYVSPLPLLAWEHHYWGFWSLREKKKFRVSNALKTGEEKNHYFVAYVDQFSIPSSIVRFYFTEEGNAWINSGVWSLWPYFEFFEVFCEQNLLYLMIFILLLLVVHGKTCHYQCHVGSL